MLLLGHEVSIASPEDVILAKLEWSRRSGSDRQLADARSIVQVQAVRLDFAYLHHWAGQLGVDDLLPDVLHR